MTPELMATFYRDGFVVVPGACSAALRDAAKRKINRSLGQGPDACPAGSPFKHVPKLVSSCPELMIAPEITDLFRKSEAIKCVHSLLGAPVNRIWAGNAFSTFSFRLVATHHFISHWQNRSNRIAISRRRLRAVECV